MTQPPLLCDPPVAMREFSDTAVRQDRSRQPTASRSGASLRVGVSVVIPTLNGAASLEELLPRLMTACREHVHVGDIVVVDDGSDSENRRRLDALCGRYSQVVLVRLAASTGQVHATLVGVSRAAGEIIVTMDDDGAHPPEVVPRMVQALRRDPTLGLVYAAARAGTTDAPGTAGRLPAKRSVRIAMRRVARAAGTRLNNLHFHLFLGLPWSVPVGSFRAIRRDLLDRALATPVRYPYLSAMLLQSRPRVACVRYRRRAPSARASVRATAREGYAEQGSRPAYNRSSHGSRHDIRRLVGVLGRLLLYWGPLRPFGRLLRAPQSVRGSVPVE
ncbi:MAG: glycosyltransferase family 2 protein [Spirochaetaceae bacterium]